MLRLLRRLMKPAWRRPYHLLLAWLAVWRYGFPSRRLTVIAVTGTDGKTTTATLLAATLGPAAGLSSTVFFRVGDKQWLNESHMTMPGRFQLQRLLRQMVNAGGKYAVIEVSSEGLAQGRLAGIDVDVAILTNITPEHIQSHGSFEKYQAAKLMLFQSLARSHRKIINGQVIPKMVVVNGQDPAAEIFLGVVADRKIATLVAGQAPTVQGAELVTATDVQSAAASSSFTVYGQRYTTHLPGKYNVANALQAVAVAQALDVPAAQIQSGLATVRHIPGRFEVIDAGNGRNVIIDYALTPAALRTFYQAVRARGGKKIIAVFGAAGGGRDAWKRPELGKIAAELTDVIIITTDDPFDEDPRQIADTIKQGVPIVDQKKVEIVLDRRRAIARALELAQPGDVIALTGMGSETSINIRGGKQIAWNDADVVHRVLGQR